MKAIILYNNSTDNVQSIS